MVIGIGEVRHYSDGRTDQTSVVKCDCGNVKTVANSNLRSGRQHSCGCTRGNPRKHGDAKRGKTTVLFKKWSGMLYRCSNPRCKNYFGRGITVCEQWKESFSAFRNWSYANGYAEGLNLSIDRIDNDKGYSPDNCRWVKLNKQSSNRRCCVKLTAFGKTQNISDWSKELGINEATIRYRIKHGLGHEEALRK